jgi:hypothetical protein
VLWRYIVVFFLYIDNTWFITWLVY